MTASGWLLAGCAVALVCVLMAIAFEAGRWIGYARGWSNGWFGRWSR